MDPLVTASLIGGGAGLLGSGASGAFAIASADQAWKRQKKVLQNQIQWRVKDLKKAGLNPILAANSGLSGGGGASVPMAPTPDFASGMSRGADVGGSTAKKTSEKQQVETAIEEAQSRIGTNAKLQKKMKQETENLTEQNALIGLQRTHQEFLNRRAEYEAALAETSAKAAAAALPRIQKTEKALEEFYEANPWVRQAGEVSRQLMGGGGFLGLGLGAGAASAMGVRNLLERAEQQMDKIGEKAEAEAQKRRLGRKADQQRARNLRKQGRR